MATWIPSPSSSPPASTAARSKARGRPGGAPPGAARASAPEPSGLLGDRPHLDGAVRQRAGELERLVEVRHLDDEVAAELLRHLGERAVGDHHLAVAPAQRGGGGALRLR